MSDSKNNNTVFCSFVSIHYIICECGETFPNEDDLKTHLETEHPHKTERRDFKCGLCGHLFTTEEECLRHHKNSHTVKIIKPPTPPPLKYITQPITQRIKKEVVDGDNFSENGIVVTSGKHPGKRKKKKYRNVKSKICEVCGKNYASNAALRYHQRVHTGERPYQCNYCDKAFTMPLFLQIHHRIHTGEKPYQCTNCPKAFGNKAALLRHDRVHTGVKPYTCPQCFKSFSQSNSMKLHVHTVHLRLPTPYKSRRRREKSRLAGRREIKDEPGSPETITLHKIPERATLPKGLENIVVTRGPNKLGSIQTNPSRIFFTRGPNKILQEMHFRNAGVISKLVPGAVDEDNTPSESNEGNWELTEEVVGELQDMSVVKIENQYIEESSQDYVEEQSIFYDNESSQSVLYEVIYEQE